MSALLRRALLAPALALVVTTSVIAAPTPAEAATRPGKVVLKKTKHSATTSTLKIAWKRPAHATRFAVCLKSSVHAKRCTRFARTSRTTVSFKGLRPTSGTDYVYRIRSYRGSRSVVTGWKKANLAVGKGSANAATAGTGWHLSYRWSAVTNAGSYQVQLATDRAFRSIVRDRTTSARTWRFTGLDGGTTYHLRVRGINGTVVGRWGPTSTTKLAQVPVAATVLTYNLCGEDRCRTATSGDWFLRNVPAWTTRKPLAGALVRSASPDVVITQESATSTAFQTQLPGFAKGGYKSARAIFYKTSRFTALAGGWMTLDSETKRYATWNRLRDRRTGTTFFVVNAHLEPYKGVTLDQRRDLQVRRLIARVDALNVQDIPVIWAGDWNSNDSNANQSNYPGGFDAPRARFAQIGVHNSVDLTENTVNAQLNSANQGIKAPKANGDHVDAIYVPSTGVRVTKWAMLARFSTMAPDLEYTTPFPSDHNPVVATLLIGTP